MKKILEAFANDNLISGPRFFKKESEYGRAMKRLTDAEETLIAHLDEEERALLHELTDAEGEMACMSGSDRFIYGYRLGVLMTMEVFVGRDTLIAE